MRTRTAVVIGVVVALTVVTACQTDPEQSPQREPAAQVDPEAAAEALRQAARDRAAARARNRFRDSFDHFTTEGSVIREACLRSGTYRITFGRAHLRNASMALSHTDPNGVRLIDASLRLTGNSLEDAEQTVVLQQRCYQVRVFNEQAAGQSVGVQIDRQ